MYHHMPQINDFYGYMSLNILLRTIRRENPAAVVLRATTAVVIPAVL